MLHLQFRSTHDDQWHTIATNQDHRKLRLIRDSWAMGSDPIRFRIVSPTMLKEEDDYIQEHSLPPFMQRQASAPIVLLTVVLCFVSILTFASILHN